MSFDRQAGGIVGRCAVFLTGPRDTGRQFADLLHATSLWALITSVNSADLEGLKRQERHEPRKG